MRKATALSLLAGTLALAACGTANPDATTSATEAGDTQVAAAPASSTVRYSPVVDTGQSKTYGKAAGQDGDHEGNQPSYSDNGDGTVTDNVTGLIWYATADLNGDGSIDYADKLTQSDAATAAEAATYAGFDDWRLPTIDELYSLMDFSGSDPSGPAASNPTPFIDTDYFAFAYGDESAGERQIDAQWATSTLYTDSATGPMMFGVNFADGRIKGYWLRSPNGEKEFYVYLVRGSEYGVAHYTDNGDGTVTDDASGLMWAQDDSGAGMDWYEALAWVEEANASNYLGHDDWRLPNAKELQSLVDYDRSPGATGSAALDPAFNATEITNEAGQRDWGAYWTSTTHLSSVGDRASGEAVYVSFGRSMGYFNGRWQDVHGAGAQRSDPKSGDASDYPEGHGPQGDAIRIDNFVRLVRDAD